MVEVREKFAEDLEGHKQKGKMLFPPPDADEVHIIQPVMKVFLNCLGNVMHQAYEKTASHKTQYEKERYSPAKSEALPGRLTPAGNKENSHDKRKARKMDKSLTIALGRFLVVMRDDNIEFPIEEKTGYNANSNNAEKLLSGQDVDEQPC